MKEERPVRILELMGASIGSHRFDVLRAIHLQNRTTGSRVATARVRAAWVRRLGLRGFARREAVGEMGRGGGDETSVC